MILIDAFYYGSGRGVGNYSERLSEKLLGMSLTERVIVLAPRHERKAVSRELDDAHVQIWSLPRVPFPLWENVLIPLVCWFLRPRLLHSLGNSTPLVPIFTKRVVTIHDVMFLQSGEDIERTTNLYQLVGRGYLAFNLLVTRKLITKVITVSFYSKREIVEKLGLSVDAVDVIYEGAGQEYQVASNRASEKFYVHFGAVDPRKNTKRVVSSFLASGAAAAGFGLKVFGMSKPEWFDALVDTNNRKYLVRWCGFVTFEELSSQASSATALIFCSLCEGFGMPIIEFQLIGVPVITSDSSACAEVCGVGGVLVDPSDEGAIRGAIDSVLDQRFANSIAQCGRENAARFCWTRCALETVRLYEEIT